MHITNIKRNANMTKEFEIVTEYHKTFRARSREEAEEMADAELCKMNGLGNDWVWSEYVQSIDLEGM